MHSSYISSIPLFLFFYFSFFISQIFNSPPPSTTWFQNFHQPGEIFISFYFFSLFISLERITSLLSLWLLSPGFALFHFHPLHLTFTFHMFFYLFHYQILCNLSVFPVLVIFIFLFFSFFPLHVLLIVSHFPADLKMKKAKSQDHM